MRTVRPRDRFQIAEHSISADRGARLGLIASCAIAAVLALFAFYLSLVATSAPLEARERIIVNNAIDVIEKRGFEQEAFMLRHIVTFRATDHWLNHMTVKENAYASTNFPFQVVTLYPDFYSKTADDTERAMVLLHEAQHLKGKDEAGAYSFVWTHREQLGWTQLSHGTTPAYVTISEITRANAPELFVCPAKLWNDCTENLERNAEK